MSQTQSMSTAIKFKSHSCAATDATKPVPMRNLKAPRMSLSYYRTMAAYLLPRTAFTASARTTKATPMKIRPMSKNSLPVDVFKVVIVVGFFVVEVVGRSMAATRIRRSALPTSVCHLPNPVRAGICR